MPPPSQPISTSSVLLETSAGAFVLDLFGSDCPALTGNFVNLCRSKFWAGAVATEVVPEVAIFFSHAADAVYDRSLLRPHPSSEAPQGTGIHNAGTASVSIANDFWHLVNLSEVASSLSSSSSGTSKSDAGTRQQQISKAVREEFALAKRRVSERLVSDDGKGPRRVTFANASPSTGTVAAGALGRKGLLIVEAAPSLPSAQGTGAAMASSQVFRFGLTLSDRAMDFMDRQYVAIGAVREGHAVLEAIRRAPYTSAVESPTGGFSYSSLSADPVLKQVLPLSHETSSTTSGASARSLYVAGATRWPRPLRMLRLKHVTVLPTPGTEPFLLACPANVQQQQQQRSSPDFDTAGSAAPMSVQERKRRLAEAFTSAGCFTYWADDKAVRLASRQLVRSVRETQSIYKKLTELSSSASMERDGSGTAAVATLQRMPQPLVQLPSAASAAQTTNGKKNGTHNRGDSGTPSRPQEASTHLAEGEHEDVVSIEYNPHYTAEYLSSDDDEDAGHAGSGGAGSAAAHRKELAARREAAKQLHQSKANETLSLMLNILNGVADVSGELQPPDNVLFVCKLNPATTSEGLAMCFRQFGDIVSADVVTDKKTGNSLCYGFVEFSTVDACYRAFQKMDRALIDDCRIHVDFSQSVSKLWFAKKRDMRKRGRE